MQLHRKLLLVTAITCASAAPAAAQQPAPAAAYQNNSGVMVGFGIGLANAMPSCEGCESELSFGFDFNLGGFLNPRLAIMYDVGAWADSENEVTLVLSSNTVAAQYWVAPQVWIKGGAGLSLLQVSFDGESDSESGLALTGAAGYEVMQNGNFAMDLSGRLSILDFDGGSFTMFHALLGFRWK
jgi:hypothetical protein